MAPCSTGRGQPPTDVNQLFQQKKVDYAQVINNKVRVQVLTNMLQKMNGQVDFQKLSDVQRSYHGW